MASKIAQVQSNNLVALEVNQNWGRNMIITSHVLARAAGITWQAIERDEHLTVTEALYEAMQDSGYNYEQLV